MKLRLHIGLITFIIHEAKSLQEEKIECSTEAYNSNSSCHCQRLERSDTPWSVGSKSTAPGPRRVWLDFYNYNGNTIPVVTWELSTQYLNYVDGFYMEMTLLYQSIFFFNCTLNFTRVERQLRHHTVLFEFKECCLTLDAGLQPWDHVLVQLHSLPLYSSGDNIYSAETEMIVPEHSEGSDGTDFDRDFFNFTWNDLKELEKFWMSPVTTTQNSTEPGPQANAKPSEAEPSIVMIFTYGGLACLICFVCGITGIACCIRRKLVNSEKQPVTSVQVKRVLYLCDEDSDSVKLHARLLETIQKLCAGKMEIVANIQKQTDIATAGITSWTRTNMEDGDVTTLIVVSKKSQLADIIGTKINTKISSAVNVALQISESKATQSSFGDLRKRIILVHTGDTFRYKDKMLYCTHYSAPEQVESALKHILGERYSRRADILKECSDIVNDISCHQSENDGVDSVSERSTMLLKNDLNLSASVPISLDMNPQDTSISLNNINFVYSSVAAEDNNARL